MNHSRAVRLLVDGQRWFFLALLVFAPWAYGSTRPWTIDVLSALMALLVVWWIAGCGVRLLWPQIIGGCLCCVGLLLAQGWWMVANAKAEFDSTANFLTKITPFWGTAPGSIERGLSLGSMERFSGLLLIICFASDLAQRPVWRNRLWCTIGLTGTSIVIFGLIERVARAPMIFWELDRESSTFFSTFFYHANAGAYINLVLPLIAGLAIRSSSRKGESNFAHAFWMGALLITLAGAFVNFSRGAQFTTVVLVLGLGIWQLRRVFRRSTLSPKRWPLYAGLGVILLIPIILLWEISTADRWAELGKGPADGRVFAARVTLRMLPDAGPLGFGPGTFRIGFPFYYTEEERHSPEAGGFWRYAHNDYLQTAAEWGWFGAALWVVLFGGGLVMGFRTYLRSERILPYSDRVLLFTSMVALLGIALHALFDFPLQIASLQLYTSVFLGLGWGSSRWAKLDQGMRNQPPAIPVGAAAP